MRGYVHLGKIHRFSHFWVAVPVQWFVVEFGTHLFGPQYLRVAKVQGVDSESIPGLPVGRSKNLGKLRAYLSLCRKLLQRARQTMAQLEEQNIGTDTLDACRAPMDQKRRDQIPHEEKVFLIHAPYTRWITKGKAGVKAELGLPVGFLEDPHPFILRHQGETPIWWFRS